MFFDYKKSLKRNFLLLTVINLVTYACFHTLYNLSTEALSPTLVEIFYYLEFITRKCCDFILPIFISSVALLIYGGCSKREWLVSTLLLSTSVVFYSYPYYYVYHVTLGFDSYEALGLALLATVVSILALAAHSLILFLAVYSYFRLYKKVNPVRAKITECAVYTERLDLKRGMGITTFIVCLCEMVFRMVYEIYGTVVFFIDVGLFVSTEEVITIILSYVLIIALFVLGIYLCDAALRYTLKNDFYQIIDDGKNA